MDCGIRYGAGSVGRFSGARFLIECAIGAAGVRSGLWKRGTGMPQGDGTGPRRGGGGGAGRRCGQGRGRGGGQGYGVRKGRQAGISQQTAGEGSVPSSSGQSRRSVAVVNEDLCTLCCACVEACRFEAVEAGEASVTVNGERCSGCGVCVEACPVGAIRLS